MRLILKMYNLIFYKSENIQNLKCNSTHIQENVNHSIVNHNQEKVNYNVISGNQRVKYIIYFEIICYMLHYLCWDSFYIGMQFM